MMINYPTTRLLTNLFSTTLHTLPRHNTNTRPILSDMANIAVTIIIESMSPYLPIFRIWRCVQDLAAIRFHQSLPDAEARRSARHECRRQGNRGHALRARLRHRYVVI